jgi:hypothetical protein
MNTENKNQSIIKTNENINNCNHPQIVETRNKKNLTLAMALLLSGAVLTGIMGVKMMTSLLILGILIMLFSGFILTFKLKQKVYRVTGSVIKPYRYYFDRIFLKFAENLFSSSDFDNQDIITLLENGNVCCNILLSEDQRFAAVQIFEYTAFVFEPATPIYYFTDSQASKFAEYINRCKVVK